jgi:FtsP/CotA-like multicopper oxidase with cupredoxin domain
MNRRKFLVTSSLGIGSLALGCGGFGRGSDGEADSAASAAMANPPPGPTFADPTVATATRSGNVLDLGIEARVASVSIGGNVANVLTYNGSFVAPTIRARAGDLLRLHFTNSLPASTAVNVLGHPVNVTNVHVHGMHVSPSKGPSGLTGDDAFVQVSPGGSIDYEYDLALQPPGSMGLYHPHSHGTVAEQIWGGLIGAIDVGDGPITALSSYETHILVLKDITLSNGAPAPYTLSDFVGGKQGTLVTVNGQLNPVLTARPGQVQRWRIFNASTARFYRLALEGHVLQLVGTDGGLLDRPYPTSEILVSPGERVDVLVQASLSAGAYRVQALPYDRGSMGMMGGSTSTSTVTLLTADVTGARAADALPSSVNPTAARLALDTGNLQRAAFTLGMMMSRASINGVTFDVGADGTVTAATHDSRVGTYEVWDIVNATGMDHPWHHHVNTAQLLSTTGGDASFAKYAALYRAAPAYKDTVIVPKQGSVSLLVPILDYTGRTVFHCHVVEHEDIGMMGVWNIAA